MSVTPYHLGPSGLIGLALKKWVDVPVFIAANVLVDLEVLGDQHFAPGWPVHQLWHFHTLLVGGLVGAVFGLLIYWIKPLRRMSETGMKLLGLPVRATWLTMTLGGLLGAWTHVLTDAFYHHDVQLFWPYPKNPMHTWILRTFQWNQHRVHHLIETACLILLGLAVLFYALLLVRKMLKRKTQTECSSIRK